MKVIAARHTDEHDQTSHLVYDTDDVESFETPRDVVDVTEPGDTCVRRELGQAHLLLHFRKDARPMWVLAEAGDPS